MIETVNPATGQKIKEYPHMDSRELDVILKQAHEAVKRWRKVPFAERASKLRRFAEVVRKHKNDYAVLMALEMGKPVTQGEGEIEKCAWVCEYYADEGEKMLAPQIVKTDATKSYISYEPLGILLAVMPWNFPFWQVFRCLAPALMVGNAFILKHAANVTGCALAIETAAKEAGFPSEIFRAVLVTSEQVGEIIRHPLVRAVTLTGGNPAGKAIASQAGQALKKTVLELGGSDPYLVFEDADIELAAGTCAASRMINGGQSCVAAKRFLVHESVVQRFEEIFIQKLKAEKMGDPLDRSTTLGPLARKDLRDELHKSVEESIRQGAKLVLGGKIPDSPGFYYPATVLTNVRKGMHAYDNETFGPVATITTFKTEEEAIQLANDTIFGLGAAIFTRDTARGERLARQIEAGSVFINTNVKSDPRLPFGGIKDSGYGRELSSFGLHEFVNIKTVYVK